jgi:hypothetical protein
LRSETEAQLPTTEHLPKAQDQGDAINALQRIDTAIVISASAAATSGIILPASADNQRRSMLRLNRFDRA